MWQHWIMYLWVVLHICVSRSCARVLVHSLGNEPTNREYILVLKQSGGTLMTAYNTNITNKPKGSIQAASDILKHKHSLKILKQFEIGSWKAILVDVDEEQMTGLENEDGLQYIEPNLKLQAFIKSNKKVKSFLHFNDIFKNGDGDTRQVRNDTGKPVFCYEQIPRSLMWHLPRISSYERPNYDNDPYLFTNIDMGQGVDVYIGDTGIRTTHVELAGRASHGFKAPDLDEPDDDLNGHGTNVASLVAGHSVGSAKEAHIVSVKVLGADGIGSVSWIIEGMQWITNQVTEQKEQGKHPKAIINLSLGTNGISYALDDVIQTVVQEAGIPVVAAAGNAYTDTCYTSPARLSSVISVAASTSYDTLASFSNYGPCVDLLAPGQNILGAWATSDDTYAEVSGTSQATPLVTGIIARYMSSLEENYIPTPSFLKEYIVETAGKGYISFSGPEERDTSNRLLHRACESLGPDLPEYRPPYPNHPGISGDANIVKAINLAIIMAILSPLFTVH